MPHSYPTSFLPCIPTPQDGIHLNMMQHDASETSVRTHDTSFLPKFDPESPARARTPRTDPS